MRDRHENGSAAVSCDVVIIGAGLAGLCLARHLLLETDKKVLVLDRRSEIPPARQKVGESTVQVGGFYLSKVLDLEEYLLREHYMKYNLRFYWRSPERGNQNFEDLSQAYIRTFSNVASYQLDRNKLEEELLRRGRQDSRFRFAAGVSDLQITLDESERHTVTFNQNGAPAAVRTDWVVDATGRARCLARQLDLKKSNSIQHGSFFWWVEGLIDIEKLTDSSAREARLRPDRGATGHSPVWLATNHFMGEGFWFWVIPLQGKTSLGLVYDSRLIPHDDVFSVEKATAWVCERFPLFARDLPHRKVLDFGGYRDFSYDCTQTISASRWALTGESGRFSDPLYSPGSDLIAIHNTLIVDAIASAPGDHLGGKCRGHEQLMRAAYAAYEPSYAVSYDALGDPEVFTLKYVWELSIYFAFYVFPFINDLLADRRFQLYYLRTFSRLGPINAGLQKYLSDYFQWKKRQRVPVPERIFFDFTEIEALRRAEGTFYRVGVSVDEAKEVLVEQSANVERLARLILSHTASVVLGDPPAPPNAAFVESFDLQELRFDPEEIRRRYERCRSSPPGHDWTAEQQVLSVFRVEGPEERSDAAADATGHSEREVAG